MRKTGIIMREAVSYQPAIGFGQACVFTQSMLLLRECLGGEAVLC